MSLQAFVNLLIVFSDLDSVQSFIMQYLTLDQETSFKIYCLLIKEP